MKRNAIANAIGRLWSAALTIATVPVFVRVLGAEAYGLVAIFSSLNLVIALLDLGLTATINREIARYRALNRPASDSATLLRTFEVIYWAIAIAIGAAIASSSGPIAHNWVNVRQLSRGEVQLSVVIMAVAIAARWPVSMYGGVLQGLERQVRQNAVVIAASTARTAGAAAVVLFVSPTVAAFLWSQVAAAVIEVVGTAALAWRGLAAKPATQFDPICLRHIWRFALSFNLIGALAMVASQADRLIISRFRLLEEVGFYAIASTAAGAVPLIASSVGAALFPKFSAITARHDRRQLTSVYTDGLHAVALLAVPASMAVLFFSRQVLEIWMHSAILADRASAALSILAVASLLNALQNPAYNLLLAAGRTRVVLTVASLNTVVFIGLMLVLIPLWGIKAAAGIWLAQNVVFAVVYPRAAAEEMGNGGAWTHAWRGVAAVVAIGAAWFGAARLIAGPAAGVHTAAAVACALLGYAATALVAARAFDLYPFRADTAAAEFAAAHAVSAPEQEFACRV